MSIFDRITNNDPRLPCGVSAILQCHVNLEDSYGDFYRIDETGQLWRLTRGACMGSRTIYAILPEALNYSDVALEAYVESDAPPGTPYAYFLRFEYGRLIRWRKHPESR